LQSTHGYGFNPTVLGRLMTRSSSFIEYMKLHLISLQQDWETADTMVGIDYIEGQIEATRHLLSVATDIMNASDERYE